MSQYLLKISGSNEIVNVLEWGGSGSLQIPSIYELELLTTSSAHFMPSLTASIDAVQLFNGTFTGDFIGNLSGSVTLNGVEISRLNDITKFGTLTFVSGAYNEDNYFDSSFMVDDITSPTTIIIPLTASISEEYKYNYSGSINRLINTMSGSQHVIKLKSTIDTEKQIELLVNSFELTGSNNLKLNVTEIFNSVSNNSYFDEPNLYGLQTFDRTRWYVDFQTPENAYVGKFYGDFNGTIGGKDTEELLKDKTKFGSLLINYNTDTTTDPGNNYFKYNVGLTDEVTEVALSMVIHRSNEFRKEAYTYEKTWTEIETKKYYGSLITLRNIKSNDYKILKINSAQSTGYPNGFIRFGVTEVSSYVDETPGARLPAIDDEYSVEFEVLLDQKTVQKTVFTQSGEYTIPVWAKKITVVAIGGGGGGGAGVGILKYGKYPLGDSKDLPNYVDGSSAKDLANISLNPYTYKIESVFDDTIGGYTEVFTSNDIEFVELVGGGGGAGGNVVWKEYTTDYLEILTKCSIIVGKGGKGFIGGNGRIIERPFIGGYFTWEDSTDNQKYQIIPKLKVENSTMRQLFMCHYIDLSYNPNAYPTNTVTTLYTRSGKESEIYEWGSKRKYRWRPANSGWDSVFSFQKDSELISVVAEGGVGGLSGYAIPKEPNYAPHLNMGSPHSGYFTIKNLITDNAPCVNNFTANAGPTHSQNKKNGDYDQILLGAPGAHGVSMSIRGGRRFANSAPNLPWSSNTDKFIPIPYPLDTTWGNGRYHKKSRGVVLNESEPKYGLEIPSDYAPTGGGGGNGPILYLLEQRDEFILNNPGMDVDDLGDSGDPFGYYGFGYAFDGTDYGRGGKNTITSVIFDDITLGEGGNGGNFLTYPRKNITPSLPTNGGLYGGGGGGGASLFFDIGTPDEEINGQNGADGADGVIVIIAEN